ncbi:MAG: hypothetical protein WCV82_02350 [Candidatus Paceibacterota bacterium]
MKIHIITIFDKNRLGRALAFRESLAKYAPGCHVRFLCLDQEAYDMTNRLNLDDTTAMLPEELDDKELLATRAGRTNPEFASTCKPALLSYMMESGVVEQNDLLVFIDDDFFFYQPLLPLFEKIYHSGSIAITPHRFPPHREHETATKGIYNAGIVFFKNDPEARKCLKEWRLQCLKWCYLRYENGQIGDQGYLSDWPKKYKGVYEIPDIGVNLGTWNIKNYKITRNVGGDLMIDDQPLICYHFHGLRLYLNKQNKVRAYPITVLHSGIYKPCIEALEKAYIGLMIVDPKWVYGTIARPSMLRLLKQAILRLKY